MSLYDKVSNCGSMQNATSMCKLTQRVVYVGATLDVGRQPRVGQIPVRCLEVFSSDAQRISRELAHTWNVSQMHDTANLEHVV